LTPEEAATLLEAWDKASEAQIHALGIGQNLSETELEQLRNATRSAFARQRLLFERPMLVGSRKAIGEQFNVDPGDRRSLDELGGARSFAQDVRRVVRDIIGGPDDSTLDDIVRYVPLSGCPGTWLRHAVDEQTLRAERTPVASNWLDYQHVSYLPYVRSACAA
jgi:hypothetical protein